MSWGLWVHAGDVAKEGVPALLDEVSNVREACTTSDINVLDFMEPAHTEGTSLTVHVECMQVVQVHLSRGPCLGRIEQHWHDESHVQT
jgi:predicted secreted protein